MVGYLVLVPADRQPPFPVPDRAGSPGPEDADDPLIGSNTVQRTAHVDGRRLDLTYLEFELLAHLVAHRAGAHRDHLVGTVWGYGHVGDGRTVDVHIARLRRKLGAGHRDTIRTVRRVGYTYVPPAALTRTAGLRQQIPVPPGRPAGQSHRIDFSTAGRHGVRGTGRRRGGPRPGLGGDLSSTGTARGAGGRADAAGRPQPRSTPAALDEDSGEWDVVVDNLVGRTARGAGHGAAAAGPRAAVRVRVELLVYAWAPPAGYTERAPVVAGASADADLTDYARDKRAVSWPPWTLRRGPSLLVRAGLLLGPHENIGRCPGG
ncbi:hypothetical protein GCM10023238_26210 [Streptomyces heliomycini]